MEPGASAGSLAGTGGIDVLRRDTLPIEHMLAELILKRSIKPRWLYFAGLNAASGESVRQRV